MVNILASLCRYDFHMRKATTLILLFILSSCGLKGELESLTNANSEKEDLELVGSFEDSTRLFVSLQVDWGRKLIYTGSTDDNNQCLHILSFDDLDNVKVVGEVTSTSSRTQEFGNCRSIKLYDNNSKLLVTGRSAMEIVRYNLGATPEDPTSWDGIVASYSSSADGLYARIQNAVTNGTTTEVYFSVTKGWMHLTLTEATNNFAQQAKYTSMLGNNSSIFIPDEGLVLTQRTSSSDEDINITELADGSTSTVAGGAIPNATGVNNNVWSSVSSSDGLKHAFLGHSVTFVDSSSPPPVVSKRELTDGEVFRAATSVTHYGKDYFFAVTGGHRLEVYDVTDISNPEMVYKQELVEMGDVESYGIQASLEGELVIVGTYKGVINIYKINNLNNNPKVNSYIPEISIADATVNEPDGQWMFRYL